MGWLEDRLLRRVLHRLKDGLAGKLTSDHAEVVRGAYRTARAAGQEPEEAAVSAFRAGIEHIL